jgi:predicted Zn-ribbon and HTH transcriptional regulator
VAYGFGMFYHENNIDTRLFSCDDCGELFSGNINKLFIPCPKCKRGSNELKIEGIDEKRFGERINSAISCPSCKMGTIQLKSMRLWD